MLCCIAFAVYVISVCLLCLTDLSNGPEIKSEWFGIQADKIAHFLMFFPFPVFMTIIFGNSRWSTGKFLFFITVSVIIGAASGGAIELLQAETGYRSCDINDFRADCLGVASGALLTVAVKYLPGKKKKTGK